MFHFSRRTCMANSVTSHAMLQQISLPWLTVLRSSWIIKRVGGKVCVFNMNPMAMDGSALSLLLHGATSIFVTWAPTQKHSFWQITITLANIAMSPMKM